MNSVSILLNLTGCLSFEDVDPFMSLVSGKGSLLFYDQLSVKRFPSEKNQYEPYLEDLLSNMRNLLESRSLTREDGGGHIRLIIIIDLAGGLFEPQEEGRKCFPAQKARLLRQCVEQVFGENNPLLSRFTYSFVFLDCTLPAVTRLSSFYRTFAFDGFTGTGDWISPSDLCGLNSARKDILAGIEEPNDELPIDAPALTAHIADLRSRIDHTVQKTAEYLDQAGVGEAFREIIQKKRETIHTLRDLNNMDYDGLLQTTVCNLIGLSCPEFRRDCTFFIIRYRVTPAAVKQKDELTLTSLALLLVTISDSQFKELLMKGTEPSVFILGTITDDDIDKERLQLLRSVILECRNKLDESGDQRMKQDGKVEYMVYDSQAHTTTRTDSFASKNEELNDKRQQLQEAFKKARRVPLFFGSMHGDWEWYKKSVSTADEIYQFELMNGHPHHDSARRITEKEMTSTLQSCSYADLMVRIGELSGQEAEVMPTENLNNYFGERKELLKRFKNEEEKMKKEMLQIGFFNNLAWISIFLSLAFALCYAFHFFYNRFNEHPLWIVAALAVSLLAFGLGALVSRQSIKNRIEETHHQMDNCCTQMNEKMYKILEQVNNRILHQKQADLRRRNLTEMQEKIEIFNRHNLQVDRWETFFIGLLSNIDDTMELLSIPYGEERVPSFNTQSSDFPLMDFPSIPDNLCKEFHNAETRLNCYDRDISGVVCFIKRFECTKILKQ